MKKTFLKFLQKLADFQANLLLTLIYFLILPFFALIFKLQKREDKTGWQDWKISSNTLEELKKQF